MAWTGQSKILFLFTRLWWHIIHKSSEMIQKASSRKQSDKEKTTQYKTRKEIFIFIYLFHKWHRLLNKLSAAQLFISIALDGQLLHASCWTKATRGTEWTTVESELLFQVPAPLRTLLRWSTFRLKDKNTNTIQPTRHNFQEIKQPKTNQPAVHATETLVT